MKIQESFLFFVLLHWARQLFLGIAPFISDPGNLRFLCVVLYQLDRMTLKQLNSFLSTCQQKFTKAKIEPGTYTFLIYK